MAEERASTPAERLLARALRPVARVEPSEAVSAGVLTLTVFMLLMAYYFLKTAREPLILLQGGAEVKIYSAAGQSLLLLLVVPAYGALARRVGRMKLLASVYGFFAANLLVFAALAQAQARIGVAFYLWVGVFSVTAIAQFWSFANDVYTPEQGKRLFAVLGIGSSVGAVAGAFVAGRLAGLGPQTMMLAAAVVLLVCIALFVLVERRFGVAQDARASERSPALEGDLLRMLVGNKYLLRLGALAYLLNFVNTNGEYLLDRTLLAAVAAGAAGGEDASAFIGRFKADYFGWVNLIGVLMQLFAVSRILERVGVRRALFVLPIVSFTSYTVIFLLPVVGLIRIGKIAENSLDYSLQNTARQALFLVGTRAEKYVGKTLVDTLFVRLGDLSSAALVFVATQLLLPTMAFAAMNLGLIVCWMLVILALQGEHKRRSERIEAGLSPGPA